MTDEPARRAAKLELLVRRDDGESFDVREFSSGPAFVRFKPERVDPESFELTEVDSRVDGRHRFILKNRTTDRFLLISDHERFLWELMDGRASVQDMATAYVVRYGEFDFDIIPTLIRKLQRGGLLVVRPSSLRQGRGRLTVGHVLHVIFTALERINISSRRVQPFFDRLYRAGGFILFSRLTLAACLVLGVAGLAAGVQLWHEAEDVTAGLGGHALRAILSIKLLLLASVAVHQLVHGLALVHYGRRVREFGFTFLHGIVPTFYVDVTDIFMTKRRARLVTAVSGTFVHLVLGSLWFILATRLSPGYVKAFAAASGMIQWQTFVVALYPFCFIEMDGYHVLVDALGVPTLKSDALGYVRGVLSGQRPGRLTRERALWIGYVVLSIVSIAAFIGFNALLIFHATH